MEPHKLDANGIDAHATESTPMINPVSRAVVESFYSAYTSRDPERIGAFLDDNVEWYVAGPAEVMHVCGVWHGKAAVIDRFARIVPGVIDFKGLDLECLLVDGDRSAMFGQVRSCHRQSGRMICHRVAQFARYRDDKVISFRVINDSLDAAEQFIGHHIDLSAEPALNDDDVIAV
jgi:ketosteroid isomerase-like protein